MATIVATKTRVDRLNEQRDMVRAEMQLLLDGVKARGSGFTPDEDKQYAELKRELASFDARIDQALSDAALIDKANEKTGGAAMRSPSGSGSPGATSFLRELAQTPFFKFLAENRGRLSANGAAWTTPTLELIAFAGGADLLAMDETAGSAGALVVPEVIPGIVPAPTRPLVVADLMGDGTTTSNAVTFMAEKTITNAAAPVAPGGLKPQSDIVFEQKTTPVRKIATWVEIVSELLEDVPGFAAYINQRLMHFVRLAEDNELLNGDGTGDHFLGITHLPGLAAPIVRTDPENNADAILRQISAIETATQETVSGIVMHPLNWNALLLLKDSTGNYIASGGPFGSSQRKTVWGRDVAVTPAQTANAATVGAYKTASQFRRRTPLRVQASNSHQDFFVKNKVAVLAEERGALVVYREAAFGQVTSLTAA